MLNRVDVLIFAKKVIYLLLAIYMILWWEKRVVELGLDGVHVILGLGRRGCVECVGIKGTGERRHGQRERTEA